MRTFPILIDCFFLKNVEEIIPFILFSVIVCIIPPYSFLCKFLSPSYAFPLQGRGNTALMCAAASGHTGVVKELLKGGININQLDVSVSNDTLLIPYVCGGLVYGHLSVHPSINTRFL